MKRKNKALCLLLAGLMITSNYPATAYAEETNGVSFVYETETNEETALERNAEVQEESLDNSGATEAGDFEYEENSDGITITKYTGSATTIDLANGIDGKNIVAIGNRAFEDNYTISKVILPETVSSIGSYAFANCKSLTKVSFSGENPKLQTISNYAFSTCSVLSDFPFPERLNMIGVRAFQSTSLSKIVIPKEVVTLGSYAFAYCDTLQEVEVKNAKVTFSGTPFNSCKATLTFLGEQNSTAQEYAANNGFRFNRYTDSISVNNLPTKTLYYYGEELNTVGFEILVDYTSDTEPATEVVAADVCNFSGYNKNKVGKQTITASYAGKSTTFEVGVFYNLTKASVSYTTNYTYTGKEIIPELKITGNETSTILEKDKDYTVECENNVNVGNATLRIVGIGNYAGEVVKTFNISQKTMNSNDITASFPTISYNGLEQKPVPVVKDGETELTENDYIISGYSYNTNAGTAKMTIQGQKNYNGSKTFEFTILPKEISTLSANDIPDQIYTGSKIEPEIVIPIDEYSHLEKGTDYTVRFANNTEIGTAKVLIEGTGNYTGSIEKTFTIKAKSLEDVTVDAINAQTYTGEEIKPVINVYDEKYGVSLKSGTDYVVSYENNIDAGTATITLVGKGSYEGTIEKTFIIEPAKLAELDIALSNVDTCVYSGEEQQPSFVVKVDDEKILNKDTDYVVSYKDNINAGTATIILEGKGNYKGTIEKTFTIEPIKLENATVNDLPGYTYSGEAMKPAIDLKVDGISLVSGKDYTVTYENNINVGTASVIIKGKGNYTGVVERNFDIKKKSISNITIRNIADHIYTGSEMKPVVSLELDMYTTLTAGVDYMVSYQNNVNVGTATVKVQGVGNYTGIIEKTFKINPKSLADASIVTNDVVYYTGQEMQPTVSVVSGGKTLYSGIEYTVTYKENKNIGTATVTVKGIGNYTGTISKNFTIEAKKGSSFYVGAYKYKVSNANEVAFSGLKNKTTKKVTIPAEVKIGGKKFKVTSIANKALKSTAVTSVTIGKNVKKIGTSAFEKCSKLKKITVKGTVLKNVGKKAFKGINNKAVIKVPKKKLSAYKKMMKNKGQSSTVKIK